MLYKGEVKLLGTPEEFRKTTDAIVVQFTNGLADGPMDT
jgi:ABC-type transporter Mla maintaining outer membrane lipid asymmetry ATPase subunit MlaF